MNTKKIILSSEEQAYIDNNWKDSTHEAIATKLRVSVWIVTNYCMKNGYRKLSRPRGSKPDQKKKMKPGPAKNPIQRPPAAYGNTSRDEHIDKWLNAQI